MTPLGPDGVCDDGGVPDRLTTLDASFLRLEAPTSALHVGSVMILEPPGDGFDLDRLVALVAGRIGEVPRYRSRLRQPPGGLVPAAWLDDPGFDLSYHVRCSALPRPGTMQQLEEFVARVQSRPLDRDHPLWEVYLVEGLRGGRLAVVTKTHQALVDGINAVDLGHLILDDTPEGEPPVPAEREHSRDPGDVELIARAVLDLATHPWRLGATVRGGLDNLGQVGRTVLGQAGRVAATAARTAALPAPPSPLGHTTGAARRVELLTTQLEDYRRVRAAYRRPGLPEATVTDVMLTAIAGGLRTWMQNRDEPIHSGTTLRALVPVGVADGESSVGFVDRVVACIVDLPVGEPSPLLRLERVSYQMRRQTSRAEAVGATDLSALAGFAPATLHHLGARLGSAMSRRLCNLVITNVPGPQRPLYAAGARMVANYPVIPLVPGQSLSIGLTSYDGSVCLGLNADRGALPDLDLLGHSIEGALAELLTDATGASGTSGAAPAARDGRA